MGRHADNNISPAVIRHTREMSASPSVTSPIPLAPSLTAEELHIIANTAYPDWENPEPLTSLLRHFTLPRIESVVPADLPVINPRPRRGPFSHIPSEHKFRFLQTYAMCGNQQKAANSADVDVGRVWVWRRDDAEFDEAFRLAKDMAGEALESEAARRAMEGVEEDVYFQGIVCGTVRKYSDPLLMFLLKGQYPGKYRDSRMELTGKDGGPIRSATVDLTQFTEEELEQARQLALKARGRGQLTQGQGQHTLDVVASEMAEETKESGDTDAN